MFLQRHGLIVVKIENQIVALVDGTSVVYRCEGGRNAGRRHKFEKNFASVCTKLEAEAEATDRAWNNSLGLETAVESARQEQAGKRGGTRL